MWNNCILTLHVFVNRIWTERVDIYESFSALTNRANDLFMIKLVKKVCANDGEGGWNFHRCFFAFRNAFFRFNWFFINSEKCNIILMFFRNTFGFFRIWMKTTLSSAWSIFNRTGVKGDQGCSWTNEEPSPFPWGDKSYI